MPRARDSYRHGDLRRALLQESISLIESEGVAAVSLREVARRVGVTHAAPYHHFPDKASLLRAAAEEGFRGLGQQMAMGAARADDPLSRLAACGMGYIEFGLANPGLFRLMFRPELTGVQAGEAPAAYTASWEVLVDAVRSCQEAGHCAAAPTETLATLCWSAVHGLTTLWLDRPLQREPQTRDGEAAAAGRDLGEHVVGLLNSLIAQQPPEQPA